MTRSVLGIIGGSGIYDLPGLEKVRTKKIKSPWGEPSAALRIGAIEGLPVVFLSRHDKGHRLSPSDINYRANIDVLKRAGVTDLISLSACGSFREDLPPGTFVLVDQFVDRTHKRENSFFGKGCVAHISMAHPVSPRLRIHLAAAAEAEGIAFARTGTYVCMEGPQFSSLAESLTYKAQGFSVIGMTNMPEAKLAREAEICYASVAMVTDFDCWHPDHDAVTVQDIIAVLHANAGKARRLVARLARDFPPDHEPCPIGSDRALDTALITAPEARDAALLPVAPSGRARAAYAGAAEIAAQDIAVNQSIGRHGLALVEQIASRKQPGEPVNILTHCNAGWLATVDWGTATAPIYLAHDRDHPIHVWVDETRPRNQGASLTAWELGHHGVPHTVIADKAGGHLMQHGLVDLVIVGTDRTSANGDVCNKIGTYLKALAAHDNGVPFYVALPSSTIDFGIDDGIAEIPIEQRSADEVATMTGRTADGRVETVRVVTEGSPVANYGFDVTPARLVTGLITERGVLSANRAALSAAFPERIAAAAE